MRRWLKPDAIKNCKLERPWTLFESFQLAKLFNEFGFHNGQWTYKELHERQFVQREGGL